MASVPLRLATTGFVVLGFCAAAASLRADRLDCLPAQESGFRETDRVFLDALPGSNEYLPFPFPSTNAERGADLTYELERWQQRRARGPVGESPLHRWANQAFGDALDAGFNLAADLGEKVGAHLLRGVLFYLPPIREGKVRFTFESVEDWTHVRCVYSRARTWTVYVVDPLRPVRPADNEPPTFVQLLPPFVEYS
jgi:hypothetical protein